MQTMPQMPGAAPPDVPRMPGARPDSAAPQPADARDVKRSRAENADGTPGGTGTAEQQRVYRWSPAKYLNPQIPAYVPPEFVIFDGGLPLEAFQLRAEYEDLKRMVDKDICDMFFLRRHGIVNIPPRFDRDGKRTNTTAALLVERRERVQRELTDRAKRFNSQSATTGEREIIKKVYFTPDQMESRAYGAILGARGQTHQKLEKETKCHIVLGGKGITDMKKSINLKHIDKSEEMAEERPHCRITAPNESALQLALEKVEWILSDDPEAIRFRDENRKQLAMINGTYDAATWVPTPIPGQERGPGAGEDEDDDEVNALLDD